MEYTSYKDYLRKTREIDEIQVQRTREAEGQSDPAYLRMLQDELVEYDEKAESDEED